MDEENSYVEKTVYGTGSHTLYFTAGPTVGEGGLLFYIHKTGSGPGYIDDISLKNIQVTSFLSDYKDSSTLYLGSNGSSYKTSTSSYL
jgi:hypothetical protein